MASTERGWETRREATRAKNLTLSLQYVIQNRTARPNVEGGVGFLTSQVRSVMVEEAALSSEWAAGPSLGELLGRKR